MTTTTPASRTAARRETVVGLVSALSAFGLWGISPIYFKALAGVGPVEILAHRVVWTVVLMAGLILVLGRWREVAALLGRPRRLGVYALTTALISYNWLVFIWAILNARLLEVSLGYFINPLVNVLLGVLFLRERLTKWQLAAVLLAATGVAVQVGVYGAVPWIALTLAVTFGFYALVRKKARIDPVLGLLVETALMLPPALALVLWLGATGAGSFGQGWSVTGLLVLAGPVTGLPLVLFMHGAQRLALSTVGLMQYLAPTIQFLLAVLAFGEPFSTVHLVTFACIWAGLALYSWDAMAGLRRQREQEQKADLTEPAAG